MYTCSELGQMIHLTLTFFHIRIFCKQYLFIYLFLQARIPYSIWLPVTNLDHWNVLIYFRGSFVIFTLCVALLGPICLYMTVYTVNHYMEWNMIYRFYVLVMVFYEITAFYLCGFGVSFF
jgi:hypothetical protein